MPDAAYDLRRRLQWFLLLRVGLTTCLLGMTAFLYHRHGSSDMPAGGWLLGAIGFTYFVSLVSGLLLTRVRNLALFSYVQVVFDTFFITGTILLTGGLDSPFPFLYHLAILNAALLLFRPGALVAASLASLCYGGTIDLLYHEVFSSLGLSPMAFVTGSPAPGLHLTVRLAVTLSSFYAIALLGSYLSQRLARAETLLAERDVALGRLSLLYQGVIENLESKERGLQEAEELARAAAQEGMAESEAFAGLVGRSQGMAKVYQLVTKVADSTTTVLITGESGTGKELVAQAIHAKGPRAARPFVAVNCGAIPATLMESELFGHVKGAFTDAVKDRVGLFQQADGGTLFLDEVGELPLALQVKLLRVLQNHEVTPVGGSKGVRVEVRVLAATNRNLAEEVAAGRFREDLFYRLNVISVPLPPLRERQGDLPLLIHHFFTHFAAASGKAVPAISPEAMRAFLDYAYPGNIRELQNLIQHAVTMAEGDTIRLHDLPFPLVERRKTDGAQPDFFHKGMSLDTELEEYEQKILRAALEKAGGVQKKAAEVLGINYRSLRHRLQKYHLS